MVVALSRFRVANGLDAEVRAAFLQRPHLVDHAAGFIGMEVFTDRADPAVFFLVTRWTDLESYRVWHGSAAHGASHQWIPKGLKLDAGFTRLLYLDRIEPPAGETMMENFALDWSALMQEVLQSDQIYFLVAGRDGVIRSCNPALAALIGIDGSDLAGRPFWPYLTEADATRLREHLRTHTQGREHMRVNIVSVQHIPYTVEFHIETRPDAVALAGAIPRETGRHVESELMQLNNQLSVLAREHARQKKELQHAKAGLERTLQELNTMYWHLRKTSEVLPFCMRCGMVQGQEQHWQTVLEYFKKQFPFLSHGYCPACAEHAAAEWYSTL